MSTALGLIALFAFIAAVILLASGVTWVVVRISPAPGAKKPDAG